MCVCVRACVRACACSCVCVRVCVPACVRACVAWPPKLSAQLTNAITTWPINLSKPKNVTRYRRWYIKNDLLKRHGPFVAFYFYCKIMLYGINYTYYCVQTVKRCFHVPFRGWK